MIKGYVNGYQRKLRSSSVSRRSKSKPWPVTPPKKEKPRRRSFRLSIRYKLAFPILILVTLMLFLLFWTTFKTVRVLVLERNEGRLKAITEVFAETIKVPLILNNQQVLLANVEWMAKRADVLEVRVEDSDGVIVGGEGGSKGTYASLSSSIVGSSFFGVKRVSTDTYAVAVPIRAHERRLGRVMVLFNQEGFEAELRQIFEDQMMVAFIMAIFLALMTAGMGWLSIRPIFHLQKTVQKILSGDLSARAQVNSFDEIEDLGDAFNEMVARLAHSLDNLRSRTEALEESEEKYRLIVENASDIILTLTPQGDMVLLNRGFSGISHEELLTDGLPLYLALHTEDSRKMFQAKFKEIREAKKPITNVSLTHISRSSDIEIFYLVNMTPVNDHQGNLKVIQIVMRDVTELRRVEMMKDSLIRDVAHELKTPTAKFEMAVSWFEKELLEKQKMEAYREVIELLKNNTDRLMRTITSIMDLSKLESGVEHLVQSDLDLNEVLVQVYQDMEPICRRKSLQLEKTFSRGRLLMKGDRDMLYRLFVNLIGNAVKFTKAGKISMRSAKENGQILVSVTDTGMGLLKDDLETIFGRFVQKTPSSVGIGVGLTISRDIAKLHQGNIWAESEGVGKGTTFKVEFPVLK